MGKSGQTCTWCGKRPADLREVEIGEGATAELVWVCGDDCESAVRTFYGFAETHIVHFFAALLVPWIVCGVVAVFTAHLDGGAAATAIGFIGMGLGMLRYPFATPQTIGIFGVKQSVLIVRVVAVIVILLGPVSYLLIAR